MSDHYEVRATAVAARQIASLRATVRERYEQVEQEIATQGCLAFTYRLTGTGVDHFCDRHLNGRWRVIAAFAPDSVIWILLVGEHLRDQAELNVYQQLYDLAGIESEPLQRRSKPECCAQVTDPPTVDQETVDNLVDRSRSLTRRQR